MRSVLIALILSWLCAMVVAEDGAETSSEATTVDAETTKAAEAKRQKTKTLMKPSFIPYCVTRDVCKPVCDCAIYENCELLEMNADVRNRILISLNTARSVQTKGEPQASGMPKLIYDMELEEISKCWTARCENEYSECFRTPYFEETTQTVGLLPLDLNLTELPLDYWDRTIQIWLGEVRKTTAEVVSSLPAGKKGEDVHSYAQILADRILRVGCAWSRLVPTGTTGEQPSLIFVCSFAPRGPRQGEQIYKTGKACSTCTEGYQCDYKEPFEFLCKESAQSEQQEKEKEAEEEEQKEKQRGALTREESVDYIAPYLETTEPPPKQARSPQPRIAVSSAGISYGLDSFAAVIFFHLVKFIR